MITTTDIAPFAGTVGGGFFIGFIAGYTIKKVTSSGKFLPLLWYGFKKVTYWKRTKREAENEQIAVICSLKSAFQNLSAMPKNSGECFAFPTYFIEQR